MVRGLDPVGKAERHLESLQGLAVVDVKLAQATLCSYTFLPDAALLFSEKFVAYVVVVVSLQKLALLGAQALEVFLKLGALRVGLAVEAFDVGLDIGSDRVSGIFAQLDPCVLVLDGSLDGSDAVMGLAASTALAAEADEVLVVSAVAAGGSGVDQAAAALAAIDGAAQVAVVTPAALARGALLAQDLLHPLECLLVGEFAVEALARLAVIGNDPDVVRITQHRMYAVGSHRDARAVSFRSATQASTFEDGRQFRRRIVTGGVKIESLGDERTALGVYGDRPNLSAID